MLKLPAERRFFFSPILVISHKYMQVQAYEHEMDIVQREETNRQDEATRVFEKGPEPEITSQFVEQLVELTESEYLKKEFAGDKEAGLVDLDAKRMTERYREGVDQSIELAARIESGEERPWWNINEYRERMKGVFNITSEGQFVTVMGPYALNRVAGTGPLMIANHSDLFPGGDGRFMDALTNATVTNLGQGYPLQMAAVSNINRITGGAQCPPYHPGPLMEQAAAALIAKTPLEKDGTRVAWFNSGGDAVAVGIAAAEKYTTMKHGENGRRKAGYFKEAYHGNIEGRAGRVTGGINEMFHHEDRNSVEFEFPDKPEEVEPALAAVTELMDKKKLSCLVFESTQGDGGGISMHPDFFVEMMRLSLDRQIPLIADEVQSGFGRSGKVFDVEYLLDAWKNSSYVKSGGYPDQPPLIMAMAKNMTNGAVPGSAVVLPNEYAVLTRAQGLNTYSAHPTTLAATIATAEMMQPELLQMVMDKRAVFDNAIQPYINPEGFIRGVRGHGLHLFLDVQNNQALQVDLIGRRRVMTGTVARNGLRVHAPINAPDEVWHSLGTAIGQIAGDIEDGRISPQALQILQGGTSGLAAR